MQTVEKNSNRGEIFLTPTMIFFNWRNENIGFVFYRADLMFRVASDTSSFTERHFIRYLEFRDWDKINYEGRQK